MQQFSPHRAAPCCWLRHTMASFALKGSRIAFTPYLSAWGPYKAGTAFRSHLTGLPNTLSLTLATITASVLTFWASLLEAYSRSSPLAFRALNLAMASTPASVYLRLRLFARFVITLSAWA